MLLVVDIGNTNITLGIFDNDKFIEEFRLASDKDLSTDEYEVLIRSLCKDYVITDCILGSVVDELNLKINLALKNAFNIDVMNVTSSMKMGLTINTDCPKEEIGADRIANAVAANILYDVPAIVVDFGTATTFDIVNSKKEFVGGVIAPGVNLQMKVLNKFTSKLPKIQAAVSDRAIGTNTTDCILSGVIRGTACMIDGLISQCEEELGQRATIIATGGYSSLIARYMKRPFDYIDPILTLNGLRYLYQINTVNK